MKWKSIGVLLSSSIWNDQTAKYSLKKIKKNQWGSGIFPFPRQYLSTDSFHLHLCPFSRGKKKQPDSESFPHMISWLGFLSTFIWCSLEPSYSNPRTYPVPLSWIRGWISTFCSVFIRLHTGREKRGCICCNRSPDWVMSCNNSGDWGWGVGVGGGWLSSGLEMAVHKDKQTGA